MRTEEGIELPKSKIKKEEKQKEIVDLRLVFPNDSFLSLPTLFRIKKQEKMNLFKK